MAEGSQGTLFYFTTVTVGTTDIAVNGIKSISGPGGQASIIDVTALADSAKAKIAGITDEGQITLSCNLDATDSGQTKLRECRAARTHGAFIIQYPTTVQKCSGTCYVTGMTVSGGVDNALSVEYTLEVSGATTWAVA